MAKGSLAMRAGLALGLMVTFYALAIGAIAGLAWLGITVASGIAQHGGRGGVWGLLLCLACLVASAVIAWSVLPRWDRFKPPGVEVTAKEHPELFAEIERIASATGQRKPAHVYLVPDVNAFVAQRGGIMGFGSRRVMGIGLPLMRTLQVDELRAVLAHEMGHFYGGDTRLGPWIYKTRGALGRTVANLSRAGEHAAEVDLVGWLFVAIRAPFYWFFLGFMRISQAVSRAQEYSADAVAIRAEGQRALIEGLKKTHAAAVAHAVYLRSELEPLVEHGKLPEVGGGFTQFLSGERMTKLLDEVVEAELAEARSDPYDSHPPLRDRIAAADEIEGPIREPDPRPAIALVRDAETIETTHLESCIAVPVVRIRWDDVPAVWVDIWRAEVGATRNVLSGIPAVGFTTDMRLIYEHAVAMIGPAIAGEASAAMVRGWWAHVIGAALAVKLVDAGFSVSTTPGAPPVFQRGDERVELFKELRQRIEGELSDEAWKARCEQLGITGTLAD